MAELYGIEAAIILKNLSYWIEKNSANNSNFFDGRTWTYNSMAAWEKLFPYMSKSKIRRVLDNLVERKVLLKGNYNSNPYDRTLWYAFADHDEKNEIQDELSICQNQQMENSEMTNQFAVGDKCITNSKPYSKPYTSPNGEAPKHPIVLFPESEPPQPSGNSRKLANEQYPEFKQFIDLWCIKYPSMLTMPKDGAKVKSIIRQVRELVKSKQLDTSAENVVEFWRIFVDNLHRTWGHGKDLSTIDSKLKSLVFDLENPKAKKGTVSSWESELGEFANY